MNHLGYANIVKLLVESRANINVTVTSGFTLIHTAAARGKYNLIDYFMSNKTKLIIFFYFGFFQKGYDKIVDYLMKNYADTKTRTYIGESPLHLAARHGEALEYCGIFKRKWNLPIFLGHVQVMDIMIRNGLDIDVTDNNGSTVLLVQSEGGKKSQI